MRAHPDPAARAVAPGRNDHPLSVLQVVTCRGWSSDAWNSVALCQGLQEEGHRVFLLCRDVAGGRAVAERARRSGVREVGFLEASGNFHPTSYLRDLVFLRRLVRERAVDAIHLHRGMEHWLAALAFAGGRGPAVVRTRHILNPVRRHIFNRWLYGAGTDRVVAVCEKIRRGYVGDGAFPADRFVTIMGGVDASAYDPADDGRAFRRAHGIPREAWVIGAAGSLRMWMKGQDVLLRAAARFRQEGGDVPWVVLIGKGEERGDLEALAAELGMNDRAVFPGYVENLAEAFSACDVLAFPSKRSEGTSRVLFEYLAAGRPIAASRVGCVEEIVRDGKEGYVVRPAEEGELFRALARLRSDPPAAERMGLSARRRAVEEFDRREMARRTVEVYRDILRSRRRSGE